MITEDFARNFADEWIKSWNSHDLDRILSHYSEDFSIESPMALKLLPESKGLVQGKTAVRAYWSIGLEKIPNLEFQLIDVLTGINGLTIYYSNTATRRKTAEIMYFNDEQKVNKVFAHYH